MHQELPKNGIRPLLTTFGVLRTSSPDIPGGYSSEKDVWTIQDKDGRILPIVEAACALNEITTKTNVQQEEDDETELALLEIETKTMIETEEDDEVPEAYGLLEHVAKTEVKAEDDDEGPDDELALLEHKG